MEFSDYLAVFGRMHPMVLHLPIGLLIGLGLMEFSAARKRSGPAARGWYLLAAVTAFAAAASGWRLHEEDGYASSQVMEWHEWVGIATMAAAIASCVWRYRGKVKQARWSLAVACLLLLPTGHLGAEMTHGKGFLFEPLDPEEEAIAFELPTMETTQEGDTPVASYATHVAPLLKSRCTRCHGTRKVKGELRLDTPEHIRAGGEGGPALADSADDAELYRRLLLPLAHDDHMPPESKTQLTDGEVELLRLWLDAGAPFEEDFAVGMTPEAEVPSPVEPTAVAPAELQTDPEYEQAILFLQTSLANVTPVEPGSKQLLVDFSPIARSTDDQTLQVYLQPVLDPYVEDLRLWDTSITVDSLLRISAMPNLKRLELAEVDAVDDWAIQSLQGHAHLEYLGLRNTLITPESRSVFLDLPALKTLNLWATPYATTGLDRLREDLPHVDIEAGDSFETEPLEIEPELVFTSDAPAVDVALATTDPAALLPQNISCPVSGKPMDPRYTIVDDGQVIGLCCPDCAKAYWEEK